MNFPTSPYQGTFGYGPLGSPFATAAQNPYGGSPFAQSMVSNPYGSQYYPNSTGFAQMGPRPMMNGMMMPGQSGMQGNPYVYR
jgi:hypothetical protein